MKNKALVINITANIIAFLINGVITLFVTPYIVSRIGSEAYGMAQLAMTMSNYVMIFTIALNSMASRFITIEINKNDNEQANIYFNSVLRANTFIALLLCLPSVLISVYVDRIFNVPAEIVSDVRWTFGFVFIFIIISLLGNIFSVATFVKNKLYLASKRNIEGNLIKFAIVLSLYYFLEPRISYVSLAVIGVTIYTVITNIYYTKKLLPEVKISARIYSGKAVRTLISSGIWNALDQLSNVLLGSLDLWIANIMLGAYLMGQYSIAKSLPLFIILFIASVVSVFAPQFTILYAKDEHDELFEAIKTAMKIMGTIVIVTVAFLFVYGDAFFALWLPSEDASFLYLLSNLILVPIVLSGNMQPLYNVFTVTNKLKIPALAVLTAGVSSVVLTFVLYYLTPLGIYAIPVASLIARVIKVYTFLPVYAAGCLKRKWFSFYPAIIQNLFCAIIATVVCYGLRQLLPAADSWLSFVMALAICGFSCLIVTVLIMFGKEEMAMVRKFIAAHRHH
jgi:O-antigen/teichoic acid export membrane protein